MTNMPMDVNGRTIKYMIGLLTFEKYIIHMYDKHYAKTDKVFENYHDFQNFIDSLNNDEEYGFFINGFDSTIIFSILER